MNDKTVESDMDRQRTSSRKGAGKSVDQGVNKGYMILLVDDDSVLAGLWQRYLINEGHQVDCCGTVADANVLLHSKNYDLLIVDIFLREDGHILAEGGVTLINRVRMQDGFDHANRERMAVLAVTGADTRSHSTFSALDSVDKLADASLQKPIKLETLGREVKNLCKSMA